MERIPLVESTVISNNNISQLPLNESRLVESVDGKTYKAIGAYTVPISRYDSLNKNNRFYSKKLWEYVISTQKDVYEGAAGLQDHPNSDPSVKDIFCVWHNLRLDEKNKLVIADMYLCGNKGQDAKDFLDAGGKLELSSSGYGTMGHDGKTVEESSYQIERPADWVFDASQSVYATQKDEIKVEKKAVEEKTNTNITENNNKELFPMDKLTEKVDILKIKECEAYLDSKFTEAKKEESLSEKKAIYNEILDYCDDFPAFEKYAEKATIAKAELEKSFTEIEKEAKTIPSLKEERENLLKENVLLKEKTEKMVAFIEQAKDACNYLKEKVVTLTEKTKTLEALYEQAEAEKNTLLSADEFLSIKETFDKEKEEKEEEIEDLKAKLDKSERVKEALILHMEKAASKKDESDEEDDLEEEDDDKDLKESEKKEEEEEDITEEEEIEEEDEEEVKEKKASKKTTESIKQEQKRIIEKSGLHSSYSSPEVVSWFEDMLKLNEARECVTKNKKELLSCSSVADAMQKYRILTANASYRKSPAFVLEESVDDGEHFTNSYKPRSGGGMDALIKKAKDFHRGNFI